MPDRPRIVPRDPDAELNWLVNKVGQKDPFKEFGREVELASAAAERPTQPERRAGLWKRIVRWFRG